MSGRGRLIVVSGPSGVGKGTVCRALLEKRRDLRVSISATTRPPRGGDVEGQTYFFKTRERFSEMARGGELLEWAEYNGNLYGTPRDAVLDALERGVSVILEIEVLGALQVMEKFPDGLFVFLAPPDLEVLRERLAGRGTETGDELEQRLAQSRRELAMAEKYDAVIINDDLDETVKHLEKVIDEGVSIIERNSKRKVVEQC